MAVYIDDGGEGTPAAKITGEPPLVKWRQTGLPTFPNVSM